MGKGKDIKAKRVHILYIDGEFSEFENVVLFFTDTFLRMRGQKLDHIVPFTNVCEISFERAD